MKFLEQWWAISNEGKALGNSKRKIWLKNKTMQILLPITFGLSLTTILVFWYLFSHGYFPLFQTKQQIIPLLRVFAANKLWLIFAFFIMKLYRFFLYGNLDNEKNPDVLIFKPKSFNELIRAILVVLFELIIELMCYLMPIMVTCAFIVIFNPEIK